MPNKLSDTRDTLDAYFLKSSLAKPDAIFLSTASGFEMTYAHAASVISSLCMDLQDAGLEPGDRLAVYCEDTLPLSLVYLASAFARLVPVPISPQFSVSYFARTAQRVDAKCVVAKSCFHKALKDQRLRPILVDFSDAMSVPLSHETNLTSGQDHGIALEALQKRAASTALGPLFMLQPTSGTSGLPKLVKRSHAAFARYAEDVGSTISQLTDARSFLFANALTHAFGLHIFTTAVSMGGALKVTTELDTKASLKEVQAMDPAILPMVPRILQSFLDQHHSSNRAGAEQRIFGPSARVLLSAGGKSNPQAMRRVEQEGVEPVEFYGSSEASIVALSSAQRWTADHVGKLVQDVDVRIADDGEILVRSPGVTSGYFDEHETTQNAFTDDGYYKTGDIGSLKADGALSIEGRKRDVFNTPEGSNIYPERIEQMLEALPWVQAAMLVGDGRPCLVAFLVLREPNSSVSGAMGYVDAQQFADEYVKARQTVTELNKSLESMERIRDVALFDDAFSLNAYKPVGSGKVRRNRTEFLKLYGDIISRIYGDLSPI